MIRETLTKLFKPLSPTTLQPLTKNRRQRNHRRTARNLKQLFAAYHFLYTTRDGAVIAHIVGAQPIDLYRWSQKECWLRAIKYWDSGYRGDGILEGEYFQSVVGDSIVERSLKNAAAMWKAQVTKVKNRKLRKTLQMFEELGFNE